IAVGSTVPVTSPASPPLASVLAMESPPVTLPTGPLPGPLVWLENACLGLATESTLKDTTTGGTKPALTNFSRSVSTVGGAGWAPELALEAASPRASAGPVRPESPERPEAARPAAVVEPLRASPAAVASTVAAPVSPVRPESPDVAIGLETAVEEAGPVSPVL